MTAGELVDRFDCSWPTVTRHLQRLLDARLVAVERRGRERLYTLNLDRLRKVTSLYLDPFTDAWQAEKRGTRARNRSRATVHVDRRDTP